MARGQRSGFSRSLRRCSGRRPSSITQFVIMFIVVFCDAWCSSEQNPEISSFESWAPSTSAWMIFEMRSEPSWARRWATISTQ